ncbi:hypothetical protein ACQPZJ_03820 [Actinoplanes sp. CA-054009]
MTGVTISDAATRAAEGSDCGGGALYAGSFAEGELPEAALRASLGCGNPLRVAALNPGETVLDLGSGGGIDVLLSARRVGLTTAGFSDVSVEFTGAYAEGMHAAIVHATCTLRPGKNKPRTAFPLVPGLFFLLLGYWVIVLRPGPP